MAGLYNVKHSDKKTKVTDINNIHKHDNVRHNIVNADKTQNKIRDN